MHRTHSNASAPVFLVWFRQDLRLADHLALDAARRAGGAVVPVYVWAPDEEKPWAPGGASRWWLHQSLKALAAQCAAKGSPLVLRVAGKGGALAELRAVAKACGARGVYWNRRYEPAAIARDAAVKKALRADGLDAESFNGVLLWEPWEVQNLSGKPFQVFTPFWKNVLNRAAPAEPLPAPKRLLPPPAPVPGEPLERLGLEPSVDWAAGMRAAWTPGERGALAAVKRFLDEALAEYDHGRDLPAQAGTSRLSPHLHFGEVGPRQVWHAVRERGLSGASAGLRGEETYLREIGWREFAHHLLFHFPHTDRQPLRAEFARFPWKKDRKALRAWQRGRTGYPIVDAGLRELWATGWMHNRVRMLAASFLVKDLRIPWQDGAAWFWDTLVDADLANNTLGWQWVAGCGADAAPYFRIFNPVTQGEKFDARGAYVRRWVPELSALPDDFIHKPWEAPPLALAEAGVRLGETYPKPCVDHAEAREAALEAFASLKNR
ncbi:MAG: deoxyribodipyrimidine photo-lyase [Planctomycetota bacterium]|nr:deoxyribodipyrimidine photo-lyase [Planctomycetota bacterium]